MLLYNIPEKIYKEPYFSKEKDAAEVIILDGYKKILSERESHQEFYTDDCMIHEYDPHPPPSHSSHSLYHHSREKERIRGINYWKNVQYYQGIKNEL